jgi:hypothetical protein
VTSLQLTKQIMRRFWHKRLANDAREVPFRCCSRESLWHSHHCVERWTLATPHGIAKTCIGGELTESDLVVVGSDQARPIQLHVIQKLACQKADANVLQIGALDARELLGTEQPPNQTVG